MNSLIYVLHRKTRPYFYELCVTSAFRLRITTENNKKVKVTKINIFECSGTNYYCQRERKNQKEGDNEGFPPSIKYHVHTGRPPTLSKSCFYPH